MNSPAFCTVITRDHLARARVLADRLRLFHGEPLYVLCVDDIAGRIDTADLPFHLVTLEDVLPADRADMKFFYTAFELCNALKPWLHRWILTHTAYDRWIYLDADILPFASFAEAFELLDFANILLTPQALTPPAPALAATIETGTLVYGVYNAGFLGIRRSAETARFLDWHAERLAMLCFRRWRDVFVDQLWLNLVPVYFGGVRDWRHPGANVGPWNFYERTLARIGDGFTVNGKPLLFAHLSNWRFDAPQEWARGWALASGSDATILAEIGGLYRDALAAAGHEEFRAWPYEFGSFPNRRTITLPMRRHWYERLLAGKAPAGSPFDHPEWFRGPQYVEWKKFMPLSIKRYLRRATASN